MRLTGRRSEVAALGLPPTSAPCTSPADARRGLCRSAAGEGGLERTPSGLRPHSLSSPAPAGASSSAQPFSRHAPNSFFHSCTYLLHQSNSQTVSEHLQVSSILHTMVL